MADISDYPDAVDRIVDAHVGPDATTRPEILDALDAVGPQITDEVAEGIADAIVTEERLLAAIEASGEIPSDAEVDVLGEIADEYDMDDRQREVVDAVRSRIATRESIEAEIESSQATTVDEIVDAAEAAGEIRGGTVDDVIEETVSLEDVVDALDPDSRDVYRTDVEAEVGEQSAGKPVAASSDRLEAVESEAAESIGAPTQEAVERARAQAIVSGDQLTPADVVEDTTAQPPVTVVTDEAGEPVVATGGPGGETSQRVADELGVEYRDQQATLDSMGLDQGDGEATLTINGSRIGEVDLR